jgi:mevalonate kinase
VYVKAPAVLKLLGEHAVVYGRLALAAAITVYAMANAEEAKCDGLRIELNDFNFSANLRNNELEELYKDYIGKESLDSYIEKHNDLGELLPYATIAGSLASRASLSGVKISISSEIPVQKGYASSAACSTAFAVALSRIRNIKLSDSELVEIAREGDKVIHRNEGAGRIDVNASFYGGIISYSSKQGITREDVKTKFNIYTVDTGPKKSTATTVRSVSEFYKRSKEEAEIIFDKIDSYAKLGLELLKKGDIEGFGKIMYSNQELLKKLGVSNENLDAVVERAKENGMLGAKLSGGGGGGIAIILTNRELDLRTFEDLGFYIRKASIDYNGAKLIE